MEDIVIYGAGGFGKEIACLLNAINEVKPSWNLMGFVDDDPLCKPNRYGPILGNSDWLNGRSTRTAVAISVASPKLLQIITNKISNPQIFFPNLFAPNVAFYDRSSFSAGEGNIVFFGCRFSCDVAIGNFNIFNGFVAFGHDVTIGSFNVFNPSARLSGNVSVGDCNYFGIQSIVLQGLKIGNETKIGAASVVLRNTKSGYLYYGNPAKKVEV